MAELVEFLIYQQTIELISMIGFEEYQHILLKNGHDDTPYDIINNLIESASRVTKEHVYRVLYKIISEKIQRDEVKGIFPEQLAKNIALIKLHKDWLKNDGKIPPLYKGDPGQDGWTKDDLERSKQYVEKVKQLRNKCTQLKMIQTNIVESLIESPTFKAYKDALQMSQLPDLKIVGDLVGGLMKDSRRQRYERALSLVSCFVKENKSNKIFPHFMAMRLASICYLKDLIAQETVKSSSYPDKEKDLRVITQTELPKRNLDFSVMPTSPIREHSVEEDKAVVCPNLTYQKPSLFERLFGVRTNTGKTERLIDNYEP